MIRRIDMRKPVILASLFISTSAYAAITGTVVDPDAKPIAGATIRAYAAESSAAMRARIVSGKLDREPVATVQPAGNGSFSIDVKGATAVDLTIEAPARSRAAFASVDGDDLGPIILSAPPVRTFRVTSGGKPIANAIVVSGLDVSRTSASGEVPSASFGTLFAVHPDYAIVGRGGAANVTEAKLTRGVAVRGRVVNGAGPVAHAIVSIGGWPLAESGDDGTFAIAHAPDNWQSISAVRGNDAGLTPRSKAASVEIRLGAGAAFTGTLRDMKRGSAVAGARMTLTGADDQTMIAVTDAKGNFTFAPLLPHGYQISGIHPGYAIDSSSVAVPATRSRAFAAQAFGRARGRVIDEEKKPVAAALVSASGGNSARGRSALTNQAGEFSVRITPSPTIPLLINASKRDYVSAASDARVWQPGDVRDNIIITLSHGFVAQVRVIDRQKGQPVPNVQVNVSRAADQGIQRSAQVACADPALPDCHRTGADGLVSVRTTDGSHDVLVFGDDVAPVRLPNQLLNARSAPIVVKVDRGIEISGRVVLADGTAVAGAIVETPATMMSRSVISAPDGTFTIAGIAAGSLVVTAFSSDRRLSSTPLTVNAPARDVTITMPRGGRIEGRIIDRATQQPVTDFSILLPSRNTNAGFVSPIPGNSFAGGQPIHADDGRYALDNIPPGSMQLLVHATGYVAGSRSDITVEDGKTVSGIDIQLDRGATVSGRVTAAAAPVAGAQVDVAFQRTPAFANSTTDADGFYKLDGLAEGDHTIEFQKAGFIVLHKPVVITAGKDVSLDAELDPGHELRGRVVGHSGQGISGAYVSAANGGSPVMTDGEGSFVMQGLADGKLKVTARKEGFISAEANDADLPQTRPIMLTLEQGATINGRVTGLAPELLTQVMVSASGGSTRNQTYAGAGGNFTLPGMPDGRIRVDAMLVGSGRRRMAPFKTVDVENGTAPLVEMNFEDGITISGRVTKTGSALGNGMIVFNPKIQPRDAATANRQMASAMISPDGSYVATGLVAGDYDVRVNSPSIAFSTAYSVVSSSTYDIDIKGALLRGRVLDASSGSPLANARITVSSRAPAYGSSTTDSDGRFVIDALADAAYTLQAALDQYSTATQQLVVSGGAAPDVEVRLEQAPAVTIHLIDANTRVPVDGNVRITDRTHAFNGQAVRIDTGVFKVWLKPGNYIANANARGYTFQTMNFTTPPSDVSIAMAQGGALFIHARSAQMVRLDQPGGSPQRFIGPIQVGMNGPFDGLAPGSYLLSTVDSNLKVVSSTPVTIVSGQTVTIELP